MIAAVDNFFDSSVKKERKQSLWALSMQWKIRHKFPEIPANMFRNLRKRGQPREVRWYKNIRKFITGNYTFNWLSWILGWMVPFSETQQFQDFLKTFPGNFRTILPRAHFEILRIWLIKWKTHQMNVKTAQLIFPDQWWLVSAYFWISYYWQLELGKTNDSHRISFERGFIALFLIIRNVHPKVNQIVARFY